MAYNKAKAERKWVMWKRQEEEILREFGFCEDAIQQLHAYDWERFKSERIWRLRRRIKLAIE